MRKIIVIANLLLLIVFSVTQLFASGENEKAQSEEIKILDVGYMPILPDGQAFIIDGKGWNKDAGIRFNLVRFSNGPAIVQALASGDLDVVYFGIGPALVARSKDVKLKVVASNIVEQIAFISLPEFADVWDATSPEQSFGEFRKQYGRKLKIATFPTGSVPDTVLKYWLAAQLNLSPDEVEILAMGNDQVQQALLSGSVDAAAILEPILTIVSEKLEGAKVLVRANEMFPGQPGAVLAVREELIDEYPEVVEKLVDLHIRATDYLNSKPEESAAVITGYIGNGLIEPKLIQKAIESKSTNFAADPRAILEPTSRMQAFQLKIEALSREVDLNELFDFTFYDAVSGRY
jgi:NitT/TauT family transport system substrate-binding protein